MCSSLHWFHCLRTVHDGICVAVVGSVRCASDMSRQRRSLISGSYHASLWFILNDSRTLVTGATSSTHSSTFPSSENCELMIIPWCWLAETVGEAVGTKNLLSRYAVAEWYGAGLAIVRSQVQIPPLAAVCQRQLSMQSLRGRLMSTSESWGVNRHTTRCIGPWRSVLPHGPCSSGKNFTLLYFT